MGMSRIHEFRKFVKWGQAGMGFHYPFWHLAARYSFPHNPSTASPLLLTVIPQDGDSVQFLSQWGDWFDAVYGLITVCEYLPEPEEVKATLSNSDPDGESWIAAIYWQERVSVKEQPFNRWTSLIESLEWPGVNRAAGFTVMLLARPRHCCLAGTQSRSSCVSCRRFRSHSISGTPSPVSQS